MHILGIETSCDETAVAVAVDGHDILSNVITSQIDKHALYGGVIPELAAREHLRSIGPAVDYALAAAKVGLKDIDAVAVTHSPGLLPALLVGISYAKGLAAAIDRPVIGINHFLAHIFGAFIDRQELIADPRNFPVLALVVSGGHTALVLIQLDGDCRIVGRTLDDAAGEAFDKGARILNLSYPGGPLIDKMATFGDPEKFQFPRGLLGTSGTRVSAENRLNFSFSGVKTALLYHAKKQGLAGIDSLVTPDSAVKENLANLDPILLDTVASYQEAVVDALTRKTVWAIDDYQPRTLVLCGGVACNSRLRTKIRAAVDARDINLAIAPLEYCTDNAAMIGGLAYYYLCNDSTSQLDLDANPRLGELGSIPIASRSLKGAPA